MNSVPERSVKEGVRSSEIGESASQTPTQGVGGVVRSLMEHRGQPKAKEQEVLDVATAYFLKHGYEGASINAMARSSGISKESIYRYFSSKKQLFEAVIGRELVEYRRGLDRLEATLQSTELRQALLMVAETVLSIITTERTQALRRLIFDEATRSPDVGHHYYKIGPEQAYAVLERLFASHPHPSDFDVQSLSRYFVAMMSWQIMMERQCAVRGTPTPEEISALASKTVDDFMKAFLR